MALALRVTTRDRAIVRDVWLFRYVNARQIARLHFTNLKPAQRRLRALSDAGFLDRFVIHQDTQRGFQTWWYRLAPTGAALLAEAEELNTTDLLPRRRRPRAPRFLRHHAAVTDFRIWLREGCAAADSRFSYRFVPEHEELAAERRCRIAIQLSGRSLVPDGAFELTRDDGKAALFTLEIDRGTEPLTGQHPNAISSKLHRYQQAFDHRADAHYCNLFGREFTGFRILCIVPDEQRRRAFRRIAEDVDIGPLVWTTTPDSLGEKGCLHRSCWTVSGADAPQALSA